MKRFFFPVLALFAGCSACDEPPQYLSEAELQNPETCQECHPDHYREWSGSMHAYASEDPVFRAMNARGQDETGGALADFCVKCHAPMALRLGLTSDGLNLDDVPQHLQGVTCYFCHNIDRVEGTHNATVHLSNNQIMRGELADAHANPAHPSNYSYLHDRNDLRSADLCGACHDIVNDYDVHLERTFAEWQETVFAQPTLYRQTCGNCHMRGRDGLAADFEGVGIRRVKDHRMVGIDTAITSWPETDAQLELIHDELAEELAARLCVNPVGGGVEMILRLDNVAAGHDWPSGAAQDRRAWVELVAYQGANPIFQTGVVVDGQPVSEVEATDPNMWVLRDRMLDGQGNEVHMFWEAQQVESDLLGAAVTNDPQDPAFYHYQERSWQIIGQVPDRVTVKVSIRPVGLEVLDDLIASGDLDAAYRTVMPTFVLDTTDLEWTGVPGDCVP